MLLFVARWYEMHQQQRTNMLQMATLKQSTSSPDEDWQSCSRSIVIHIKSDPIVRQTNKVHLQRGCILSTVRRTLPA